MSDWKPFGRTWHEFVTEELNCPGTQVAILDHREHNKKCLRLIGDFNAVLGRCSCCTEFHGDEIVLCYRVIITQEELQSE